MLRLANDNPWYCLATLHGEQPIEGSDRALAQKNCTDWNRWLSAGLIDAQLKEFETIFANRTSLKLPDPAEIVDFSHTHFDRAVFLVDGFQFRKPADFRSTTFSGEANFSGAQFNSSVDFRSATFSGEVNFSGAQFPRIAHFSSATFSGHTIFIGTQFHNGVDFESATFSGKVDFQAAILNASNFGSATFSDYANFSHAKFYGGRADFLSAIFSSIANFGSAEFIGEADFRSATFSEMTNFRSVKFLGIVDFDAATFASFIHFNNAEFGANTIFAGARFENRVPDFRGATMHEATEWHGVVWPKPARNKDDTQKQVYAYERLKQEMEQRKKHEDEQKFFRMELRARRGLLRTISPEWLLNFAYQASSDYGNSFIRPLLWLIGLFAAGTVIFARAPLYCGAPMPFKLAAKLSFANIFVFLPDKREIMMNAKMVECLSNTTQAVNALQSLLGVVLLFLLALALRNRFRMR